MGFIRGQLPAFAQARAEMQAEEEKKPSPLQQLGNAFSGGLAEGLEKSMGEYFDRQRDTKAMDGANSLLKAVGKQNPDLEELLTKGREMGLHPDAIKLATQVTQAGQTLRGQRERLQGQQKETFEGKEAVKQYNSDIQAAEAARDTISKLDKMESLLEKGSGSLVSIGAERKGIVGDLFKLLESGSAAEMRTISTDLIEKYKQIFKGRITDADLEVIKTALPSPKRTKEQNQSIINVHKSILQKYISKGEVAKSIRSNMGGIPANYSSILSDAMQVYETRQRDAIEHAKSLGIDFGYGSSEMSQQKERVTTPDGKVWEINPGQREAFLAEYEKNMGKK